MLIAKFSTKLDLGKVDYLSNGKKSCPISVEVELRLESTNYGKEYYEFSAVGEILNHKGTNIYCAGQCLDTINFYRSDNKDFVKVYEWWKEYHLNDLHAGTRDQEKALKEFRQDKSTYNYRQECEYLKTLDLYEVNYTGYANDKEYKGEPYRYGSSWLIQMIPEDVVEEIKAFIGSHNGKATLYNSHQNMESWGKDITDVVWTKGA